MHCLIQIVVILAIAQSVVPLIDSSDIDVHSDAKRATTQKEKKKKSRSTSSSSQGGKSSEDSGESLLLTVSSSSESEKDKTNRYVPKSSEERKGWRKWHRKCPPCPEDMTKKWRDKSIMWICEGYQRARRSFKSECMMYYRNCQDGTMFVKIHDFRCKNETGRTLPRGTHFFYDYGIDSEDSKKDLESDSSSVHISSQYSA